eukprot:10115531-Alexandrium_andersonii.AAC.1
MPVRKGERAWRLRAGPGQRERQDYLALGVAYTRSLDSHRIFGIDKGGHAGVGHLACACAGEGA